jgi:hypothetical protein
LEGLAEVGLVGFLAGALDPGFFADLAGVFAGDLCLVAMGVLLSKLGTDGSVERVSKRGGDVE